MPEMTNMKMTVEERKTALSEIDEPTEPQYPWGLRVDLDDEALEKLGITELPATGTEMGLTAVVRVVERSERQREGEDESKSLELQITDMALARNDDAERAAKIFDSEE